MIDDPDRPSTAGTLWQLVAILAGSFALQIAGAALGLVVPLRMALDGRPAALIGLTASANAVGFLIGCVGAASLIRPIGHIRAFAVLAAVQAIVTQVFALTDDPWLWVALRFVNGAVNAAQFVIVESWVNDRTPDVLRGRMMAIYVVCSRAGLIVGQMLPLAFTGTDAGAALFIAASAAYSLALIPVALNRAPSPAPPALARMGLRELFAVAPVSIVACFYAGFVGSTVVNVLPLYGVRIGLGNAAISVLAALLQLGALALQWPLGFLSDHRDRRIVMVGAAAATVVGGLVVALAPMPPFLVLAALIALGIGACQSVYAIGVAHAFDFAGRERTVGLSSGLMLCWGIGAALGPLVAAGAIDRSGPGGLFLHAAAFSLAFVLFALWRMTRRPPRPPAEREKFVDVTATSPAASRLDPRADRPSG